MPSSRYCTPVAMTAVVVRTTVPSDSPLWISPSSLRASPVAERMKWKVAPNDHAWWKALYASLLPLTPRGSPG